MTSLLYFKTHRGNCGEPLLPIPLKQGCIFIFVIAVLELFKILDMLYTSLVKNRKKL